MRSPAQDGTGMGLLRRGVGVSCRPVVESEFHLGDRNRKFKVSTVKLHSYVS